MNTTKHISIDDVLTGMYIIDMNLPWYCSPFLFHQRLIPDFETIQTMKQHGVTIVTIDTSKGRDIAKPPVLHSEHTDSSAENPTSDAAAAHSATSQAPLPVHTPAASLYAEAHEAVERIFADLERGVPPTPAATKAVVTRVLAQVLDQPAPQSGGKDGCGQLPDQRPRVTDLMLNLQMSFETHNGFRMDLANS